MTGNVTTLLLGNTGNNTGHPLENANSTVSITTADVDFSEMSSTLQFEIHFYYKLVVFIIGCLGNVINIIIMQLIRVQTIARITITVLAISDLFYLISNFPVLIYPKFYYITFFDVSNATCKISTFTSAFFPFLSNLMVALLAVERAVAISIPLKAKDILSTWKVIIVFSAIILVYMIWVCILAADHYLYPIYDKNGTFLYISCFTMKYWKVFQYSSSVLDTAIPFFCIIISNLFTCVAVARSRKTRAELTGNDSKQKQDNQLILTTVSISVAFLVLTGPLAIYFSFGEMLVGEETFKDFSNIYYFTLDSIYYTNFCVNFFFYVAFTKSFREKLNFFLSKFKCRSTNIQESSSVESNNTGESSQ